MERVAVLTYDLVICKDRIAMIVYYFGKVVLRESILETAILQNSNDFIEFVCSDIELNCFKYGHMKMCHMKS